MHFKKSYSLTKSTTDIDNFFYILYNQLGIGKIK